MYLGCAHNLILFSAFDDNGSLGYPPCRVDYRQPVSILVTASHFTERNMEAELKPTTFSSLLLFRCFLFPLILYTNFLINSIIFNYILFIKSNWNLLLTLIYTHGVFSEDEVFWFFHQNTPILLEPRKKKKGHFTIHPQTYPKSITVLYHTSFNRMATPSLALSIVTGKVFLIGWWLLFPHACNRFQRAMN